jgi:outer membrane protein TolC
MRRPSLLPSRVQRATVVGFASLWAAQAQADVRSLAELEERALNARPELAESRAAGAAVSAELDRSKAGFAPTFGLRAELAVSPGNTLVPIESGGTTYYVGGAPALKQDQAGSAFTPRPRGTLELTGSASLYDFGRRSAASHAADKLIKASVAREAAIRAELKANVRGLYLAWLASHELALLAGTNREDARARRELVERAISQGVSPAAELHIARHTELLLQLEEQRAAADQERARLALAEAVGEALGPTDTPDRSLLAAEGTLPSSSELDSAEAAALSLQEDAKRAQAVAEARGSRPDLRIGASVGVRSQLATRPADDASSSTSTELRAFPLYGASVGVVVPLWDGGASEAGSRKARAEAEGVRAQRERLRLAQIRGQGLAAHDLAIATQRAATAQELVAVSKLRIHEAESGFKLGAATLEQIAEARTALRRAEAEGLLARIDQVAARMRLAERGERAPGIPQ